MSWPADEPPIDITIPVFWWDYTYLMDLPIKGGRIESGTFSPDRSTIGATDGTSWTCGAQLSGVITLADTSEVYIPSMTQHLCAILSGQVGDASDPDDDCTGDPSSWPDPPDTTWEGAPAYSVSACFAAQQVIVVD